jgi:hypothetical protein
LGTKKRNGIKKGRGRKMSKKERQKRRRNKTWFETVLR